MVWNANNTIDDPFGVTWTSFETFRKSQEQISVRPDLGILTVFKEKVDAEKFIRDFGIKCDTKVIEVLFDTNISEQNRLLARKDNGFCKPGISESAMNVLMGW